MVRRIDARGIGDQTAAGAAAGPLDRRRLTLALLLAIFALNFMDRQIVAILVEPIKRDFGLSDAAVHYVAASRTLSTDLGAHGSSPVRDAELVGQGGNS